MLRLFYQWPFYLPLLAFCCGFYYNSESEYLTLILFVSIILVLAFKQWRISAPLVIASFFIFLGIFRGKQELSARNIELSLLKTQSVQSILVCDILQSYDYLNKYLVIPKSFRYKHENYSGLGYYVELKTAQNLEIGNIYTIDTSMFSEFNGPVLPGDFNIKLQKYSKGILGKINCNSQLHLTDYNAFIRLKMMLKNRINSVFAAELSTNNLALVRQLIWADHTELDDELKQAFQVSGTLHVLSVSGMHMALLYSFFSFLVDAVFRFKNRRYYKLSLIPILWGYSFLTGFSAPVLRAVLFITVYLVGKLVFGRKVNLLHALTFVAIVQLMIQPYSLYDIGFQLSYFAVLGLGTIYPFIKSLYEEADGWWVYLVDSLAISLCSTATTYALMVYYFHQFPLWFLLGNLFLLPMFTLLMYVLFTLVFIVGFGLSKSWMLWILNEFENTIHKIMIWANELPHPYLYFPDFNITLLYIHLIALHIYLVINQIIVKPRFAFLAFVLSISMFFSFWKDESKPITPRKLFIPSQQWVNLELENRVLKLQVRDTMNLPQLKKRLDLIIKRYDVQRIQVTVVKKL